MNEVKKNYFDCETTVEKMEENNVLIVDDNGLTRTSIENTIDKKGWLSIAVENGKDTLEIVEEFQPKVVMLNCVMPDMNGTQFVEKLKKRGRGTPAALLTITKEVRLIRKFSKLGVFGYLTRSFSNSEFVIILTAFKHKALKDIFYDLVKKEYQFNRLNDFVNNQDEQGIDLEVSQRILVDRQKSNLTDNFYFFP